MSGNDRDNRTVILPNPGGRRPTGEPRRVDPPRPADDDWVAKPRVGAAPQNPYQAPVEATPANAPPPGAIREAAPGTPPVAAAALLRSEAALAANEMLRQAAPLLLMLGKLRAGLVTAQSEGIMQEVARAIDGFERAMTGAYGGDQIQVAKYALAATADDVVQNIPVDDRRRWAQYSMLSQFFSERVGGIRFFEELNRMRGDHVTNVDVLEVMYACLAVGFEGVHRTSPSGQAQLQQITRDLYETIRRVRPRQSFELSPRWMGSGIGQAKRGNRVPIWVIAVLALTLTIGSYVGYRWLLSGESAVAEEKLLALHPLGPVTLVRPDYVPFRVEAPVEVPVVEAPAPPPEPVAPAAPPPPPPPSACEDVREALLADISGARIDFGECNGDIKLTIGDRPGIVLFRSGSADISDAYAAIIDRIAPVLERVPGEVVVTGHTDGQRYRGVRFASNFELSVARAEAVAARLRGAASAPNRFVTRGQGPNVPIATNATVEGRAQNRRVDIVIEGAG
ncbi:MAG: type IVB secretion system protein IcmH/DotU [Pseudomonadota bacterium]